jgi:hypothetical protein
MTKQTVVHGISVLGKDAIKSDQDGIKTTLQGLDKRIHENAVQCLIHAEIHGDTSLMRRLLVDSIGELTGYRRQGLINWMRKFSPMELTKDNINLSGVIDEASIKALVKKFPDDLNEAMFTVGGKRPFLVKQANETPFWTDSDNAERVAKPVYRDNLTNKLDQAISEFEKALQNTLVTGTKVSPIDATKPYYDGVQLDKATEFFQSLKLNVTAFKQSYKDSTREVRVAQDTLRRSLAGVSPDEAKKILGEITVAA